MDTDTRLLNLPRIRFYIQILNQNPLSPIYCLRRDPILIYMTFPDSSSNYMLLLTLSLVHTRKYLL